MDNDFAHIMDAITGGPTCTERFTELLASTPTHSSPVNGSDFLLSSAQQNQQQNDVSFMQQSSTPLAFTGNNNNNSPFNFDFSLFNPDSSLQFSAVTGSYNSEPQPLQKQTSTPPQQEQPQQQQSSTKRARPDHGLIKEELLLSDAKLNLNLHHTTSEISIPVNETKPIKKKEPSILSKTQKNNNENGITKRQATRKKRSNNNNRNSTQINPMNVKQQNNSNIANPFPTTRTSSPSLSKSHTRKCREKVTRQFEYLLEVLPTPSRDVEVKHKAQILEYTINIFRSLLTERTSLQAEIALASKSSLLQWMNATINEARKEDQNQIHRNEQQTTNGKNCTVPISCILEPFIGLYCVKKKWTYGELWLVNPMTRYASLASCVFNTDDKEILKQIDEFACKSRARYSNPSQLNGGMIARAIASQRPEWLSDLPSDNIAFHRADLASKLQLCIADVTPIVIPGQGVTAVLLFGDVKPHAYSAADVNLLSEYSRMLGRFYMEYLGDQDFFSKQQNGIDSNGVSTCGINTNLGLVNANTHPAVLLGKSLLPCVSETSTSLFSEGEFFEK